MDAPCTEKSSQIKSSVHIVELNILNNTICIITLKNSLVQTYINFPIIIFFFIFKFLQCFTEYIFFFLGIYHKFIFIYHNSPEIYLNYIILPQISKRWKKWQNFRLGLNITAHGIFSKIFHEIIIYCILFTFQISKHLFWKMTTPRLMKLVK